MVTFGFSCAITTKIESKSIDQKSMKVQPKKGLGQHFLKDQGIANRIADLVSDNSDIVIEIGPGMGILTRPLLDRFGKKMHVVEIDTESVEYLEENFPELKGRIHSEDFLKMDIAQKFSGSISVVGNYPYNISSQILFHLLKFSDQVTDISGMFQREVARRICSGPGSKEYGILSVLLEHYFNRKYSFTVSENVFNPPPKVKSGVIQLVKKDHVVDDVDFEDLRVVVKAAFGQRRKMLRNSLSGIFEKEKMDTDLFNLRPEQLDYAHFLQLMELFK